MNSMMSMHHLLKIKNIKECVKLRKDNCQRNLEKKKAKPNLSTAWTPSSPRCCKNSPTLVYATKKEKPVLQEYEPPKSGQSVATFFFKFPLVLLLVAKMILKTLNFFFFNLTIFLQNLLDFSSKNKNQLILQDCGNIFKKSPQNGKKMGRSGP